MLSTTTFIQCSNVQPEDAAGVYRAPLQMEMVLHWCSQCRFTGPDGLLWRCLC